MENSILEVVKIEPFNKGKLLEGMFKYQASLIDKYISLGKLPPLGLDLSQKDSQNFLRHTINNILEELGESYNEQLKAYEIFSTGVYNTEEVKDKIFTQLSLLQEELADILHFFLELFIYSNIDELDVNEYYKQVVKGKGLEALIMDDGIKTTFAFVRNEVITNDENRVAMFEAYKFDFDNRIAGMKQGYNLMQQLGKIYWEISYSLLYKAQNNLKEKNWRGLGENKSNISAYQEGLMEAWTWLFVLFDLYSLDDITLYKAYEDKNVINQLRLINKN